MAVNKEDFAVSAHTAEAFSSTASTADTSSATASAELKDSRCPCCPGPAVPHHCGIPSASRVVAAKRSVQAALPSRSAGRAGDRAQGASSWRSHAIKFYTVDYKSSFPLVARIIGAGGCNIEAIRRKTWAGVQVDDGSRTDLGDGVAAQIVVHQRGRCYFDAAVSDALELALRVRREHDVAAGKGGSLGSRAPHVVKFNRDEFQPDFLLVASIIGKGGDNLARIRAETGASVKLVDGECETLADGVAAQIVVSARPGCDFRAAVAAAEQVANNVRNAQAEQAEQAALAAQAAPAAAHKPHMRDNKLPSLPKQKVQEGRRSRKAPLPVLNW